LNADARLGGCGNFQTIQEVFRQFDLTWQRQKTLHKPISLTKGKTLGSFQIIQASLSKAKTSCESDQPKCSKYSDNFFRLDNPFKRFLLRTRFNKFLTQKFLEKILTFSLDMNIIKTKEHSHSTSTPRSATFGKERAIPS